MKYLTGVELLLEKAEKWQFVASKQYSLENELKSLNGIVVEWRKLELKHWLHSIDLELEKGKKQTCFIWFFTLMSLCVEFLSGADEAYSSSDVLQTLNQFIQSSNVGEYHIRLKNFRFGAYYSFNLCFQML